MSLRENQLKLNLGVGGASRNRRQKRQGCPMADSVQSHRLGAEKDPEKTPARPWAGKGTGLKATVSLLQPPPSDGYSH